METGRSIIEKVYPELLRLVKEGVNIKDALKAVGVRHKTYYNNITYKERTILADIKPKPASEKIGAYVSSNTNYELHTVEGFNLLFEECLIKTQKFQEAYEAAENVYKKRYNNLTRYRNFHSFRIARNQWLNLRKKNRGESRQAA